MPKNHSTTNLTIGNIHEGDPAYYAPCDKSGNPDLTKKKLLHHGELIPNGYIHVDDQKPSKI